MMLVYPTAVPLRLHAKYTGIIGIANSHLPHRPKIMTGDAHTSDYRNFKHPWVDVKGVL